METVTQGELVDYVTEDLQAGGTEISRSLVKKVLDQVAEVTAAAVGRGNAVNLHGIVKVFPSYVKPLPKRKAKNPFDPEAEEKWVKARPEGVKVKASALIKSKRDLPKTFKGAKGEAILKSVRPKKKKAAPKPAAAKKTTKKKTTKKKGRR